MQLTLFIFMLIFHILFCKFKLRSFSMPFSVYGFIWFSVLIVTRLPIVEFEPFHFVTVLFFLLAYFAFLIPHIFISKEKINVYFERTYYKTDAKKVSKVYLIILILYSSFAFFYALTLIRHFGGLSYIVNNAYTVRHNALENNLVPIYISYGLGFGYVAAGLGSYLLFFSDTSTKRKVFYILPIVIEFSIDFLTSGRMGIVFYAIIYLSALLLKYNSISKREKKKYRRLLIIFVLIALILLLIPKYVRDASVGNGGNYSGYTEFLINKDLANFPLVGPFMHFFEYIAGPVVAFDYYINNFSGGFTFGEAQLLPLVHLINRVFGLENNYELVYEFVDVPFSTNIYTYLREAFSDFGFFGVIMTPLLLGELSWTATNVKFRNELMNYAIFQYVFLYSVFSIFYTPFSQGGPLIGFVLYFIILAFTNFDKGLKNNGKLHYSKL